jgi:hypothetical protein
MTVSELIERLERVRTRFGDIAVKVEDGETFGPVGFGTHVWELEGVPVLLLDITDEDGGGELAGQIDADRLDPA